MSDARRVLEKKKSEVEELQAENAKLQAASAGEGSSAAGMRKLVIQHTYADVC
jgi:hypothetical protein